jgi:hypothetical protein
MLKPGVNLQDQVPLKAETFELQIKFSHCLLDLNVSTENNELGFHV